MQLIRWQAERIAKSTEVPNLFTGITRDKEQFFCDTSALGLYRLERINFIKQSILLEGCTAFAHSMKVKTEISGICVDIYAGQEGEYWWGRIENISGDIVRRVGGPYQVPQTFLQDVLPAPSIPMQDAELYTVLWNSIREDLCWRDLN